MVDRRRYLLLTATAITTVAGCTGDDSSGNGDDTDEPGSGNGQAGTDQPQSTETQEPTEEPTQDAGDRSASVRIGEVAAGDNLAMVVESVERMTSIGDFQEADEGNEFVIVKLAVKNTTESKFLNFSGFLQTSVKDDEDYSYDQTIAVTDNTFTGGQLVPGEVSRGDLVYEVPQDATGLTLQFDFEAFSFTRFHRVTVDLTSEADSGQRLEQTLHVDVHDVGETVSSQDVAVGVDEVSFAEELGDFAQAGEGMEYAVLDITTENGTDEEQRVSTALQMLVKDGEGNSYDMDFSAQSELDRPYDESQALAPGERRRGKVAYEVPVDASPLYWTFEFTLWTDGDKTFWQLR